MNYVYGKIYRNGKFYSGYLGFEDGIIKESGSRLSSSIKNNAQASGLILPTFINSHIHLADSFLFGEYTDESIKKLVAPKTGLKMKKLKSAKEKTLIEASRKTAWDMVKTGTSHFIDFREMGVKGINVLKKSSKGLPVQFKSLGRPFAMRADKKELDKILEKADGIGLSAFSDWPEDLIKKIADETHRKKKIFALHVSEAINEKIDSIIELKPDFIVHMLEATNKDLNKIAEHNIPVVVCPRANMFYGKFPNLGAMLKANNKLMLGTDNAMITIPDMLREIEFTFRISKLSGGMTPKELLQIAFHNPREIFYTAKVKTPKMLAPGAFADFIVLSIPNLNNYAHPENLICMGISSSEIDFISMKDFIWRRLK
jgi:cytosine/adenosine deaminase-related metal-dependent hydrolase